MTLSVPRSSVSIRSRVLTLALGLALTVTAAGCDSSNPRTADAPETASTEAAFAHVVADAAIPSAQQFPVNLIFVAPLDDPIWTELSTVTIPEGPVFTQGAFTLHAGDDNGSERIGNIQLVLSESSEELAFDRVEIAITGAPEPLQVAVGDWRLTPAAPDAGLAQTGEYALTMPTCERIETRLRNDTGEVLTEVAIDVTGPGVDVISSSTPQRVRPGQTFTASADFSCGENADFWILSPTVTFTVGGERRSTRLDAASVGLTSMTPDLIPQIRSRAD